KLALVTVLALFMGSAGWSLRSAREQPSHGLSNRASPAEPNPAGQKVPEAIAPARAPSRSSLRISSRPPGAQIKGENRSDSNWVTPALPATLEPGNRRLTQELSGDVPS